MVEISINKLIKRYEAAIGRKISNQELARRTGVHRQTIAAWRQGKEQQTLTKLVEVLSEQVAIEPSDLIQIRPTRRLFRWSDAQLIVRLGHPAPSITKHRHGEIFRQTTLDIEELGHMDLDIQAVGSKQSCKITVEINRLPTDTGGEVSEPMVTEVTLIDGDTMLQEIVDDRGLVIFEDIDPESLDWIYFKISQTTINPPRQ